MIDYFLLNPKNFMTKNDRYFRSIVQFTRDFFERDRVMGLLHGINGVSFGLQGLNGVQCLFIVLPFNGFFGTEGGLVYLRVRRAATDAAEHHALDTHRIGGAEDSTYIMLAAHVVQHYHQRQFVCLAVLLDVHTPHLGCSQFCTHSANGRCTRSTRAPSSISCIKSS